MEGSVNCGSVSQLRKAISRFVPRDDASTVYIATDERNETTLKQLSGAGYLIYGESKAKMGKSGKSGKSGDFIVSPAVDQFVIDLSLMMSADIFLGWGVSRVNDVVEFERMMHQHSFCTAGKRVTSPAAVSITNHESSKAFTEKRMPGKQQNTLSLSWCDLQIRRMRARNESVD
jgi:hypothetical protein